MLLFAFLLSVIYCNNEQLWKNHKIKYNLNFTNDEIKRFKIFIENIVKINQHNSKPGISYKIKLNKFAHMTTEEFLETLPKTRHVSFFESDSKEIKEDKDTVDWRKKNVVTPIKDQGKCGSCYAFSAMGVLESHNALHNQQLFNLSVQQVVDCDTVNHRCKGGSPSHVFNYARRRGVERWEDYSYEAASNKCLYDMTKVVMTPKGYRRVKQSENALTKAIKNIGPISVGIYASLDTFKFYSEGVYSDSDCQHQRINHAVILVGYGVSDKNEEYYILRNSWGESWGIDGYMHIARNKKNMCGVATEATYPLV